MYLTGETALAFLIAALLLALAPGPDNIFVFVQSALYGPLAGFVTTLGLVTGLFYHTALVALGVAVLLKAHPMAFITIKIIGALYLLYLAYRAFTGGATDATLTKVNFPGYFALYKRGIIMNVTNPKVTLFFLSLLPGFTDPARGNTVLQLISLGVIFMFATIVVFNGVALMADRIAVLLGREKGAGLTLNKIAACTFILLAGLIFWGS